MLVFMLLVYILGVALDVILGTNVIAYYAAIFAVITNFIAYWFSDKIVLKIHRAKPADPSQHKELLNIVENLSMTAGLPTPKVYIIYDMAPNAFATGRSPKHAVIGVTEGLLKILNREELEGVIAHELSHIKNRDILVATIAATLAGIFSIIADNIFYLMLFGRDDNDSNGALALIAYLAVAILLPISALLVQLAISRKREYLADASAVLLTRHPDGLINALKKISSYSKPMDTYSTATQHLFIYQPRSKFSKFMSTLFSTHPPIEDRIKALTI